MDNPARNITLVPPPNRRQSETALAIARGTARLLRSLGFSCISNMAAGILDQPLSHEEVIETTERVKQTFLQLILGIIPRV